MEPSRVQDGIDFALPRGDAARIFRATENRYESGLTEPKMLKPRDRVNEIDLMRFFAAMSVVLFHYAFRGYAANGYSPMPYPLLASFAKYGFLGVEERFHASVSQYLVNMTLLSEFVRVPAIDGVYWSLFVELKFYALVAIVLAAGRIHHVQLFSLCGCCLSYSKRSIR